MPCSRTAHLAINARARTAAGRREELAISDGAAPQQGQEVKVVVEQGPGENLEVCLVDQRRQPGEQVYAVGIIDEDGTPLDASDDHVVQTARSVETGASRNEKSG